MTRKKFSEFSAWKAYFDYVDDELREYSICCPNMEQVAGYLDGVRNDSSLNVLEFPRLLRKYLKINKEMSYFLVNAWADTFEARCKDKAADLESIVWPEDGKEIFYLSGNCSCEDEEEEDYGF